MVHMAKRHTHTTISLCDSFSFRISILIKNKGLTIKGLFNLHFCYKDLPSSDVTDDSSSSPSIERILNACLFRAFREIS